jgi:hypothetical protein
MPANRSLSVEVVALALKVHHKRNPLAIHASQFEVR